MSLCGEFKHTVDAKNRLFIPAKHREQLGDTVMVVRDLEKKCLLVYSTAEWDKYKESVLSKVPGSKRHDMNRFLYRNSLEANYDSQGRILLSTSLCEHAELERGAAVVVGCGEYDEIWNEENYNLEIEKEDPDKLRELLNQYDS